MLVCVLIEEVLRELYLTWHGCRYLWDAAVFHQSVLTAIFPVSSRSCIIAAFSVTVKVASVHTMDTNTTRSLA